MVHCLVINFDGLCNYLLAAGARIGMPSHDGEMSQVGAIVVAAGESRRLVVATGVWGWVVVD
mgnify:CR=1 FL=1